MHDFVAVVLPLEVGNLESLDRRQGPIQRLARSPVGVAQFFPHLPQRAKHTGPIEPLPFAMFAVAHVQYCRRFWAQGKQGRGFARIVAPMISVIRGSPRPVIWRESA